MSNKRRPSPTEEELNRIAEALRNTDAEHQIKDYKSFKDAWNEYFEENPEMKRDDLIDKTFQIYGKDYPTRLTDFTMPKAAKKEKLRKRPISAKRREKILAEIVPGIPEKEAAKIRKQLKEMQRGRIEKLRKGKKRDLKFVKYIGKKQVYASKQKTKDGRIIYKDRNGRFAGARK